MILIHAGGKLNSFGLRMFTMFYLIVPKEPGDFSYVFYKVFHTRYATTFLFEGEYAQRGLYHPNYVSSICSLIYKYECFQSFQAVLIFDKISVSCK